MTSINRTITTRIPELTINWHILEACNFNCYFCYAIYPDKKSRFKKLYEQLIPQLDQIRGQVVETASGPILADAIRLNFAGGEPMLLGEHLCDAIDLAHRHGMRPSVITNGIRVTDDFIRQHGPKLSMFGVSVDSFDREINEKIGRQEKNPKEGVESQLTFTRLSEIFRLFREVSPGTKLKVNTVVCQENMHEDMLPQMLALGHERWKIFRVIPVHGARGRGITDKQFASFIERHKDFPFEFIKEDNDEMQLSYLRVTPQGCFEQRLEETADRCFESSPILEVGVREALKEIPFDPEVFKSRY